jgi:hypothetical protein
MKEAKESKIEFEEDPAILTELFKSMYTGEIEIKEEDTIMALKLASMYEMKKQEEVLLDELLTKEMSLPIVKECWMHLDLDTPEYNDLLLALNEFMDDIHYAGIAFSTFKGYNVGQFCNMLATMNDCKYDLFSFIGKWVEHDRSNREKELYTLIEHINTVRRRLYPADESDSSDSDESEESDDSISE